MTYLEQESADYFSRISAQVNKSDKNSYERGYDDCVAGIPSQNTSELYNSGYGAAYELGAKNDVGNN
mgnify:CR=1 FL=1|tara:strand:+ start:7223 stop:7423 length:201 start_codon:yes stop_codon:yes gene_type:complete